MVRLCVIYYEIINLADRRNFFKFLNIFIEKIFLYSERMLMLFKRLLRCIRR